MADYQQALVNLDRAMAELESYAALPIVHRRDKAGLIQAFEFTFELFWRCFQKLAPDAGLDAASPREALAAGVKLHLIEIDESNDWFSNASRSQLDQPYVQPSIGRRNPGAFACVLSASI
jgi:hypothetical protein